MTEKVRTPVSFKTRDRVFSSESLFAKHAKDKDVVIIDPEKATKDRLLHANFLISSLKHIESRPKIEALFNNKRIESECETIIAALARELARKRSAEWEAKFSKIEWDKVENIYYPNSVKLKDILRDVLELSVTDYQINQILSNHRGKNGKFQYGGFLLQFLKYLESVRHELKQSRKKGLLGRFQAKARIIGLVRVRVHANAREKALQNALAKLVHGLRMKIEYRADVSVENFGKNNMTVNDLKAELKRIFGISLSELEASALMDVFDKDKSGLIDRSELSSVWYRVVAEAKSNRDMKVKRIKERRQSMATKANEAPKSSNSVSPFESNRSSRSSSINLEPDVLNFDFLYNAPDIKERKSSRPGSKGSGNIFNDDGQSLNLEFVALYEKAVVKLKHALGQGIQLNGISDEMYLQESMREMLRDWSRIRLTREEMDALARYLQLQNQSWRSTLGRTHEDSRASTATASASSLSSFSQLKPGHGHTLPPISSPSAPRGGHSALSSSSSHSSLLHNSATSMQDRRQRSLPNVLPAPGRLTPDSRPTSVYSSPNKPVPNVAHGYVSHSSSPTSPAHLHHNHNYNHNPSHNLNFDAHTSAERSPQSSSLFPNSFQAVSPPVTKSLNSPPTKARMPFSEARVHPTDHSSTSSFPSGSNVDNASRVSSSLSTSISFALLATTLGEGHTQGHRTNSISTEEDPRNSDRVLGNRRGREKNTAGKSILVSGKALKDFYHSLTSVPKL